MRLLTRQPLIHDVVSYGVCVRSVRDITIDPVIHNWGEHFNAETGRKSFSTRLMSVLGDNYGLYETLNIR